VILTDWADILSLNIGTQLQTCGT